MRLDLRTGFNNNCLGLVTAKVIREAGLSGIPRLDVRQDSPDSYTLFAPAAVLEAGDGVPVLPNGCFMVPKRYQEELLMVNPGAEVVVETSDGEITVTRV